jgi:aldehyde:ferredoxin oxidoreductase
MIKGYAGTILDINLSTKRTKRLSTGDYADRFIGGRGVAARLFWEKTPAGTGAFDPANCLAIMTGPVAGFMGFSGCRWEVCAKSPEMEPDAFSYANLGGSWGAWLKYAGFDGLAVTGKADVPVYLLITDEGATVKPAADLWGKTTVDTESILHAEYGPAARILSIGPAGENRVTFATILAAENASGSSGMGAVMGAKNLKAVVIVADSGNRPQAADPEGLRELAAIVRSLRTKNFEDYGHFLPGTMKLTSCYGCISGCTRFIYKADSGRTYKSFCQAGGVYMGPAMRYYGPEKGMEANRLAGRSCDEYGIDTAVLASMLGWLGECFQKGIMTDRDAGIPLSKMGSVEFIETFVQKLCYREGFGDILAGGVRRAARQIGNGADQLRSAATLSRSGESYEYDPRLMIANAISYATEPRRAVHLHHAVNLVLNRWVNWTEQKWPDAYLSTEVLQDIAAQYWGSTAAGDFSTYEGKALAAMRIQDYAYLKESLVLCDLAWPIYQVKETIPDNRFLALEKRLLNATTGWDGNESDLLRTGERIYNQQRAILVRDGWGGRQGDILPDFLFSEPMNGVFFDRECRAAGKNGERISLKGSVIDRVRFEEMKAEYYQLRGWDPATGLQKADTLKSLGLPEVAEELKVNGLALE